MTNAPKDDQIIEGIKAGGNRADQALEQIYLHHRTMITHFVMKNHGSRSQAQDILQETVITFYEKVRNGSYVQQSKISTFLYAIARFTWLNVLKRRETTSRIIETQDASGVDPGPIPEILEQESVELINTVFDKLGDGCRQVLHMSIFDHYSMQEIADNMHYQNAQVVRNKKFKCLRQLKNLLAENPQLLAHFQTTGHEH